MFATPEASKPPTHETVVVAVMTPSPVLIRMASLSTEPLEVIRASNDRTLCGVASTVAEAATSAELSRILKASADMVPEAVILADPEASNPPVAVTVAEASTAA
jgi:hypothetical protein